MNVMFDDDMEELAHKTPAQFIDELLKKEQEAFTKRCLTKVGLTERKGLDGQLMLYPIKAKDKIMERSQLDSMVKRLYKVKERNSEWNNLNDVTRKEYESKMEKSLSKNKLIRKTHKNGQRSGMSSPTNASKDYF